MDKQKGKNIDKFFYQDQTVQISDSSVNVLKFYFPQDSKTEILFKDINKVALKEMDQMDQTLGVDPSFFKDFNKRAEQNKNMYIQMATSDESVRLCFAPEQPIKVMKLIQSKLEQAKIDKQKEISTTLKQNNLYANVQLTPQKIQKAVDQLKKSEKQQSQVKQNQAKRQNKSISPVKKKQITEKTGQNPRKKVKQNEGEEEARLKKQVDKV